MDKAQALHSFWNSFGMKAYDENTVAENASFPRITYSVSTSNIGNTVFLTASLWYNTRSWEDISKKADEIAADIGYAGKSIQIDGGYLWLMIGSPFAIRMSEPSDDMIRRIILNVSAEFLTAY